MAHEIKTQCTCNYTPTPGEIYVCVAVEPGTILRYSIPERPLCSASIITFSGHLHIPHGTHITIGDNRYIAVAYYVDDNEKTQLARTNSVLVPKRLISNTILHNPRTVIVPERVTIPNNTSVWIIPGTKLQQIDSDGRFEIKESIIATID